jgi:uncharacterized integral membrane protein
MSDLGLILTVLLSFAMGALMGAALVCGRKRQ